MSQQVLSLFELNRFVKQALHNHLPDTYWVQAELSDVRSNSSGHCYLEFVQKDTGGNHLIAKARGTIWSNIFKMLKPYFEQETGQQFASGIKVLVQVSVEFHELYGYSLTVLDIDPTYTLGDMARRRREIILRLEEEGVLTMNKELDMPLAPQRIAVISSATAAGYGDFCDQLRNNPYGLSFQTKLFPAVMQGERVEESIISALESVYQELDEWDVVVLIRGGGATSDLSGFDTYNLAANCAQFPLPIVTGIGHERDETVLDIVAHTRVKTPTAAAEYLIGWLYETALKLEDHATRVVNKVEERLNWEHTRLNRLSERIPMNVRMCLQAGHYAVKGIQHRIDVALQERLLKEKHRLQLLEHQVRTASPEHLLKRGYSITLLDGKAVTDISMLKEGDVVTTRYAKGESQSVIMKIKK
ncbi:MAG: exodeoxyribonuclease VII large subunit [Bacteroidaceae bacterium]|nr:exodeoxyribonuclease VII large subunit [Bacteroidaceae bacterium]